MRVFMHYATVNVKPEHLTKSRTVCTYPGPKHPTRQRMSVETIPGIMCRVRLRSENEVQENNCGIRRTYGNSFVVRLWAFEGFMPRKPGTFSSGKA